MSTLNIRIIEEYLNITLIHTHTPLYTISIKKMTSHSSTTPITPSLQRIYPQSNGYLLIHRIYSGLSTEDMNYMLVHINYMLIYTEA